MIPNNNSFYLKSIPLFYAPSSSKKIFIPLNYSKFHYDQIEDQLLDSKQHYLSYFGHSILLFLHSRCQIIFRISHYGSVLMMKSSAEMMSFAVFSSGKNGGAWTNWSTGPGNLWRDNQHLVKLQLVFILEFDLLRNNYY